MNVVQTARAGTSGPATSITIQASAPGSNNVLVAAIGYADGSEGSVTPPAGWTLLDAVASGTTGVGQSTYFHVAKSGESGSYTFQFSSSRGAAALTGALQEVSGVNVSGPIATHGYAHDLSGNSSSISMTAPGSGLLPLAFFTQYSGGNMGQYFNAPDQTWQGRYTIEQGGPATITQEALFQNTLTVGSVPVTALETWQGGANSAQVGEMVMLTAGAGGSNGGGTAGGVATTPAPVTATAAPPPASSGSGAAHMKTALFYGGNGENTGLPASYMAAHADIIESTAQSPQYANSFMGAGGSYAMMYSDPHFIPFCSSPSPYGSCSGPLGNTGPESAWLHDSSGRRLQTSNQQDALNPASSATQNAFHSLTANGVSGTQFNSVMVDDTAPTYINSFWDYKFGAQAQEVVSQSNPGGYWFNGQQAVLASSAKPVFYNGGENDSNDHALLTSSNVIGKVVEGCVVFSAYRVNDSQGNPLDNWASNMNKLLYATSNHKYALCLSYSVTGGDSIGDRMYAVASEWLTYDPTYSVPWPDFETSDNSKIFAEYGIVPTNPLQSAGTDVNNLRRSSGVYVREFANCYQGGTAIGRCAAVVNPSYSSSASIPSLSVSYNRSLVLDSHSMYSGGAANWSSSVPTYLSPETGVILRY